MKREADVLWDCGDLGGLGGGNPSVVSWSPPILLLSSTLSSNLIPSTSICLT